MKTRLFVAAIAFAALGAAAPALAQDIDTTASATDSIGDFGTPETATYGQTFTVGAQNALDSFTLYLNGDSGDSLSFRAYIYAWSGSRAVGNAIYASDEQHFSALGDTVAFAFQPGDVDLVSGQRYVAFLTTSGITTNAAHAAATMPFSGIFNDVYDGGDLVFTNSFGDFASITAHDWDYSGGGVFGDAAFKAHFVAGNPVPEPAAWAMMIGGVALAGGALRRQRRYRFA